MKPDMLFSILSLLAIVIPSRNCFRIMKSKSISTSSFNALPSTLLTSLLQRVNPEQAAPEFYFFFFAGSGALGIGFSSIPKILKEYEEIKALAGQQSLGGDILDINPLATIGFTEKLRTKDVEDIIKNLPPVETLLANGEKKTYLAQIGYVERSSLIKSLPNANPLAIYAIFEAISGGGGSGVAAPFDITNKIQLWRNEGSLEGFKTALLTANLKKFSAYGAFTFLILLVLDLIFESGANAFL